MDVERLLLAKIVADGNLADVADAGITSDFFDDPMNRQLFRTIQQFKIEYGKLPTEDVLRRDYPMVRLPDDVDEYTLRYLTDQVRVNRERGLLQDGLLESTESLQMGEVERSATILQQTLRQIAIDVPSSLVGDFTAKSLEQRREAYRLLRERDGRLLGIPSGFASIDYVTQGFQPKQLITFVGLPKSGKSTLMLLAAMAAHAHAFRPLFLGFEMSNEEQEQRHDAILARVSHHRLRTGTLTPEEYKRLERAWRRLSAMPEFFASTDINSAMTLSGVQAQVERYEPDIVFVDGVYLMRDEEGEPQGSPQALTNITRGLKRMAQNLDLAMVESTQALGWKTDKRRGLTGDSIGYSSSFLQDSDLVVGVEATDVADINKVKVVAARSAPPMEKFIRWDWDTGTFEELDYDPFEKPTQASTDAQSGFGD